MPRVMLLLLGLLAVTQLSAAEAPAKLTVVDSRFVLALADGNVLRSEQLVGAVFDMVTPEGIVAKVRIDAVTPAKERPEVLLHALSTPDESGGWRPVCDADAYGRKMGFPLNGRWRGQTFIADKKSWFIACSSGSQGKCVLYNYDPWKTAPNGALYLPLYRACQHMVRGDYDGSGNPHTRNGTTIDVWNDVDGERPESLGDPAYAFEAGWGPNGAVCVARTRWENLLPLSVLLASAPYLKAEPCDEAEARRRGAVLFNRSKLRP